MESFPTPKSERSEPARPRSPMTTSNPSGLGAPRAGPVADARQTAAPSAPAQMAARRAQWPRVAGFVPRDGDEHGEDDDGYAEDDEGERERRQAMLQRQQPSPLSYRTRHYQQQPPAGSHAQPVDASQHVEHTALLVGGHNSNDDDNIYNGGYGSVATGPQRSSGSKRSLGREDFPGIRAVGLAARGSGSGGGSGGGSGITSGSGGSLCAYPSVMFSRNGEDPDAFMDRSNSGQFDDEDPALQESMPAGAILGAASFAVIGVVLVVVFSGLLSWFQSLWQPKFSVYSDWENRGMIPLEYGCLAEGGVSHAMSFPLRWTNVPLEAKSLILLVANPGSIKVDGTDPVQWFITNISLTASKGNDAREVHENAATDWILPANASGHPKRWPTGAVERPTKWNANGHYHPLCAPGNTTSLYIIYLYAVDNDPEISTYYDARRIMNRLSGVPTAKLAGYYPGKVADDVAEGEAHVVRTRNRTANYQRRDDHVKNAFLSSGQA